MIFIMIPAVKPEATVVARPNGRPGGRRTIVLLFS